MRGGMRLLLLSGGTRAFHPTQLPGLVALYDVSDLSSLFEERTGASASTPASVDGVVGTVLDLSGNGFHLTAQSDAARPILRENNGVYSLEFDGVDDYLALFDAPVLRNSPGTTAVVAAQGASLADSYFLSLTENNIGFVRLRCRVQSGNFEANYRYTGSALSTISGPQATQNPFVFSYIGDYAAGSTDAIRLRVDQIEVTDDIEVNGNTVDLDAAFFGIAAWSDGSNNFEGHVHFVALYDRPVSAAGLASLESLAASLQGRSL